MDIKELNFPALIFLSFILPIQSCILTKPVITSKKEVNIRIDTSRIYQDVIKLTEISPPRNNKNTKSLNKAFDYIKVELSKLNCELSTQKYKANNREFKNLIASFNSKAQKRISIGAHYDVCGNAPGADDNTSGIAGILELARLIDSLKPQLKYRVDISAFSTEEPPYNGIPMGSRVHAQSLKLDSAEIELMIALDMIGYYSPEKKSQDYPFGFLKLLYPNKANFALMVSKFGQGKYGKKIKKCFKQVCALKIKSLNAPGKILGVFIRSRKLPGLWF